MKSVLFFRKIISGFTKKNKILNKKEKLSYINSFPEPKSDFDRTLYQYKCTMKRWTRLQCIFVNIGAALTLIPYYIRLRIEAVSLIKTYDAVYFSDRISINTIPNSLRIEFPDIITMKLGEKMALNKEDINFIKKNIVFRKVTPYYLLKFIFKLGMVSYAIRTFEVKAIISYSEESFVTSLISKYCEEKEIQYIGIQHGERLLELKITFFRCSRYYLWDEYYINLFRKMRCFEKQFIIEKPETLLMPDYIPDKVKIYDYTFYLQDENEKTISIIKKYIENLWKQGKRVGIRPHPQWTNRKLLEVFPKYMIQDPKQINLSESLSITSNVVGRCSTVLFQAFCLDIPIVIDDCSDLDEYVELVESEYILIERKHVFLSEIGRI